MLSVCWVCVCVCWDVGLKWSIGFWGVCFECVKSTMQPLIILCVSCVFLVEECWVPNWVPMVPFGRGLYFHCYSMVCSSSSWLENVLLHWFLIGECCVQLVSTLRMIYSIGFWLENGVFYWFLIGEWCVLLISDWRMVCSTGFWLENAPLTFDWKMLCAEGFWLEKIVYQLLIKSIVLLVNSANSQFVVYW